LKNLLKKVSSGSHLGARRSGIICKIYAHAQDRIPGNLWILCLEIEKHQKATSNVFYEIL